MKDLAKKLRNKGPYLKTPAASIDLIPLLDGSTMMLGYFDDNIAKKLISSYPTKDSQPPQFLTINLTYIDMLKAITHLESILSPMYDDIDS